MARAAPRRDRGGCLTGVVSGLGCFARDMMKNARWLAFAVGVSLALVLGYVFYGRATRAGADIRAVLRDQLAAIKSYEMNVVYSERARDEGNGNFLRSDCVSRIKFSAPRQLFIDADARIVMRSDGKVRAKAMSVDITYDGKTEKVRFAADTGGTMVTNYAMADMSINDPATPFNGWNLKGFGLQEGKDYIGTISSILDQCDLSMLSETGAVAQYAGRVNIERCTKVLSKTMTEPQARRLATSSAAVELWILVDTKRSLVTGYTIRDVAGKAVVTRRCRFDDIRLNSKIDPGVFVFKAGKNTRFTDITSELRESRKFAKELASENLKTGANTRKK